MRSAAEVLVRAHVATAHELWKADQLDAAFGAMSRALQIGVLPGDLYDLQRMIEAEYAARKVGARLRCAEHLELELPQDLSSRTRAAMIEQAVHAHQDVTERLEVHWGKPVLITVFAQEEASLFLHARYGYYTERTERHKVCLPWHAALYAIRQATLHEVTHAAIHDAAGDAVPRWFDEGVAMWMEGGLRGRRRKVRLLAARKALPILQQVSGRLESYETDLSGEAADTLYVIAGDFVVHLVDRLGASWVRRLLDRLRGGEEFLRAFRHVTGRRLQDAEREWRAALEVP